MTVDLHTHSTYSDGSMTPEELVSLASKKGLSVLAITDHDTVDGVPEAIAAGRNAGIEVISGVEVSAKHQGMTVHLLGYLFDYTDKVLLEHLGKLQDGRITRNAAIITKLREQGVDVHEDELLAVAGPGLAGRPHFAKLLIRKRIVQSMDEAFARFLGREGSAYVSRFAYSLEEMIGVFKQSGGLAVIAHPRQLKMSPNEFAAFLSRMSRAGLDGVEAYYPTHSRQYRKLLHNLAEERKLLVTGGSDYHGAVRPNTTLAGGKNMAVPDRLVAEMKNRLRKTNTIAQ